MRKIYIIFTLFISLFLFSSNVKADKKNIIFNFEEFDFSYINDEFFKLREKTLEFINNNDSYNYYVIFYDDSSSLLFSYVFIEEITDKYLRFMPYSSGDTAMIYIPTRYTKYYLNNDELISSGNTSSFFERLGDINGSNYYYRFIDTNIDDIFFESGKDSSYNVEIHCRDFNLIFDSNTDLPTLYEIYSLSGIGEPIDIHEEEKNILLNFYTIIIEKINLLCDVFVSNYIYLSIFVIFILIFVIELLRRLL